MKHPLPGIASDVLVLPTLYNNNGKKLDDKSVVKAHGCVALTVLHSRGILE